MSSTFLDAAEERALPLPSLSVWAELSFASLPEHNGARAKGTSRQPPPCPLTLPQLQALFVRFDRLATTRLRVEGEWLDGRLPEAVTRTAASEPGWDRDLCSPFVRRCELSAGQELVLLGDLHGSLHALLRNLLRLRALGHLGDDWRILPAGTTILFLGDLVDRGEYGVEVWATVMRLYAANPDRVWLVRGNHEERSTWVFQLGAEISRKFPSADDAKLVHKWYTLFGERTPHAIFVAVAPDESSMGLPPSAEEALGPNPPPAPAQPAEAAVAPPPGPPMRRKSALRMARERAKWQRQAAEEAAKTEAVVTAAPPLLSEWVQCSHGGIEARFDPRPLLRSGKQFAVTGAGRTFEGFNWSDWTGVPHAASTRFSSRDPRGKASGFCADLADTHFFSAHTGVRAFFRGHQDQHCAFKLLVRGTADVVPWQKLLAAEGLTHASLRADGVPLRRFLGAVDTAPVFTFSTCSEARALPDEGFGVVRVSAALEEWRVRVHTHPVARIDGADASWVVVCRECDDDEVGAAGGSGGNGTAVPVEFDVRRA